MFCSFTAIASAPTVVKITTSSIVLEFQRANTDVDYYVPESARAENGSILIFHTPSRIYHTNVQTYRLLFTALPSGGNYHIRIVPYINSYRGTPSPVLSVRIGKPGENHYNIDS